MGVLSRLANLVGGILFGAVVGAGVAAFLAPQRGEDLQKTLKERIEAGKVARLQAEAETEEVLKQEFRRMVGDDSALRSTPETSDGAGESEAAKNTTPLS